MRHLNNIRWEAIKLMSKIYRITNPDTGESELLVSKEYVDLRIQSLKDALLHHEQNKDSAHTGISDTLIDNAGLLDAEEISGLNIYQQLPEVTLGSLEQDSKHRLLSDTQIQAFKDKVSRFELDAAIEDTRNELKMSFNNQYINLLNLPNAVDKLKELAKLIETSNALNSLLDELKTRVSEDELYSHASNYTHLNNNDRKALNILLGIINNGLIEKINDIGKTAQIAEVAKTAETVNGYTYEELKKCHLENRIYGSMYGNTDYDQSAVDSILSSNDDNSLLVKSLRDGDIKYEIGILGFKPGSYIMNGYNIDLYRETDKLELILRGSGNSTVFTTDSMINVNNVSLENLSITGVGNGIINIYNNAKFKDILFTGMHIIFKNSENLSIQNCTFNGCTFEFGNACNHMNISNNLFIRGPLPKYLTRTSIITNNLNA